MSGILSNINGFLDSNLGKFVTSISTNVIQNKLVSGTGVTANVMAVNGVKASPLVNSPAGNNYIPSLVSDGTIKPRVVIDEGGVKVTNTSNSQQGSAASNNTFMYLIAAGVIAFVLSKIKF